MLKGWRSSVKLARHWHGMLLGWWSLDVTTHGQHNWSEELGCCTAWTRVNDACGCLRGGTSWMLNVLMDVSEKMLRRFNLKHEQGGKHGADGGMAEGC